MTMAWTRTLSTGLLAAGLVLAGAAPSLAGPGPMQVEEPSLNQAAPPIQPEKDKASWKNKKSATLTPEQQAALKNRRETMKDMLTLIQQKRRALLEARPEDREALARELHNLILEKAQVADRGRDHEARKDGARNPGHDNPGEGDASKNARVQDASKAGSEKKIRQLEQLEEIQRQREIRRKLQEERMEQQENRWNNNGNGNGNGNNNGN